MAKSKTGEFKMDKPYGLTMRGIVKNSNDEILILQTCSTHKDYHNYQKKYLLIILRRV